MNGRQEHSHLISKMLNKINPYQIFFLLTINNGYGGIQLNQPCKFPCKFFCYSHETHEALPGPALVKSMLNTKVQSSEQKMLYAA